jgi:RNA polymerase sigma-70 factor (ECF subfamily)
MDLSEGQLIQRAKTGDRDALGELLFRFGGQVAARLEHDLAPQWRSAIDIDDVMQVTYLEAFLDFGRLSAGDGASFAAWLGRMAANNLKDAVRGLESEKRPHPSRRVDLPPGTDSYVGLLELLGQTSTTPSRIAAQAEAKERIESALHKLPQDYAQVVRLLDLEGQSPADIAQRLGRSRSAVYMLRACALNRLRDLLGSESHFFSGGH